MNGRANIGGPGERNGTGRSSPDSPAAATDRFARGSGFSGAGRRFGCGGSPGGPGCADPGGVRYPGVRPAAPPNRPPAVSDAPAHAHDAPRLRLVLCLHDHQPVGNFDGVFADACRDSYEPFLDVFEPFDSLKIALHTSGSLLEWLEANRPAYLDRVRALVDAGRVEILGGPFYEPILAGIPRRDRVGQMTRYSDHLERLFGNKVRGMWLPERVWEQQFAADISEAGLDYCVLDDGHLKAAGLRDGEINGHFLTEDDGRMIALFPGDETLRYLIPFRPPHETIEYLRGVADAREAAGAPRGTAVTFGDDGEKFGTWPGTKATVYDKGWLREFFAALSENVDWLRTATFAETLDAVPPAGEISVPDCSYREMTGWALSAERQSELDGLTHAKENDADWPALKPYVRGGNWRNFRSKYPEAREMYARAGEISARLAAAGAACDGDFRDEIDGARTHLYKAQCNCSYWHGAFGGLYLPHLRNAVYKHLIAADTLLEAAAGRPCGGRANRWCGVSAGDYDLDARKEIRLAGDQLVAYLKPSRGGHLYELDVRGAEHNLLATLDRRPEPYHAKIRAHAAAEQHDAPAEEGDAAVSIHDLVQFKQPDLDQKLGYDRFATKALVDRFLEPGLTAGQFRAGAGELSDCPTGVFETTIKRSDAAATVVMTRTARLSRFAVGMTKTVVLAAGSNALAVRYEFSGLPAGRPIHFATAIHLAGMAGSAEDRYFHDAAGDRRGTLDTPLDLPRADRLGLCDEWLGLDAALELDEPGGIWTYPVETVSGSEAGFESVFQSCAVVPHWEVVVPADGRWSVGLSLTCDASAARAQRLDREGLRAAA